MMEIQEINLEALFNTFFKSLRNNADTIRLCLLLAIHPQTPKKVISILDNQKKELLELFSNLLEDQFKEDSKMEAEIILATIDGITLDYVINPNNETLKIRQQYLTKKYL